MATRTVAFILKKINNENENDQTGAPIRYGKASRDKLFGAASVF